MRNKNGEAFSRNLIRLLRERRLTQAEVAEQIGVPRSTFCGWTAGVMPNLAMGLELARLLGVEPACLLSDLGSVANVD